jgi:cbb3-type cytochrome oxidase maturation protein
MTVLVYLIPIALFLGLAALGVFLWALKSGQYEDMDGAASRILFDDEPITAPRKDAAKDTAKDDSSAKPSSSS